MNNNVVFFRSVTYEEIPNEINSLDSSKSTQLEDIPFEIIKDNTDIFANFILQNFNKKKAGVSPVFKKGNHNNKIIYPLVSILLPAFKNL